MEAIVVLVGIWIAWWLFGLVLRAGAGTVRAVARTATGKGSFTDNFHAVVVGMGPMEARISDGTLSDDPNSPKVKEIQVKGLFAVSRKYRLAFSTSVFDETSGELAPVIAAVDVFQEPHSRAYQHVYEVGSVEPGIGLISWVRVGTVIPEILETPYSGKRRLVAILRLIDLDDRPKINQGFHQTEGGGLLWQRSLRFECEIKSKGYLEAAEQRDKARLLCVQIAIAIAMWNGPLGEQEGATLKKWVEKILANRSGEAREKLKTEFNSVMKSAYDKAKNGDLSLSQLTEGLNDIDDTVPKYETVELCFDILASSAIDATDKARVIDLVAKSLKLESNEIERIRDIKIVGLTAGLPKQVRVEDLLGINSQWDVEQIKRHLRSEFQKWNNRLMTLPEGEERENAQQMLDTISDARKKYG